MIVLTKRVSVKDIAAELHISLSTVNKALTGKPGISEQRRKEVIDTAERMGYVVNSIAQSLSRKAITIGVLMPSNWQEYFNDMEKGMKTAFKSLSKYKVYSSFYYISADEDEALAERVTAWCKEMHTDAILYCPSMYSTDDVLMEALQEMDIPFFVIGNDGERQRGISMIGIDAEMAGKLAADFLTAMPVKINAAMLTGSLRVIGHKQKVDSFTSRLTECGGSFLEVMETREDGARAYACMKELCEKYPEMNAVYVSTATSQDVCRYIQENNLQDKIILIGTDVFDELKSAMRNNVMRATIFQNQEKVGAKAVDCAYEYLIKKNSYGHSDWVPPKKILIPPCIYYKANIE